MMRCISSLIVIVMLCGCVGFGGYMDQTRLNEGMTDFGASMSPRPFLMRNLPGGDDSYSVGFRAGCETTMNFGVGMLRTHPFSYDVDRGLKDKQYYSGYRAGVSYCVYYVDTDPL